MITFSFTTPTVKLTYPKPCSLYKSVGKLFGGDLPRSIQHQSATLSPEGLRGSLVVDALAKPVVDLALNALYLMRQYSAKVCFLREEPAHQHDGVLGAVFVGEADAQSGLVLCKRML